MSTNSKSKSVRSVKKVKNTYLRDTLIQLVFTVALLGGGAWACIHYFPRKTPTQDAVVTQPVVETVFSDSCKRRISEAWTNGYNAAKND